MGKIMLNDIEYGSGASDLPSVTSADEGKVLTVDSNGDWGIDDILSGYNYSTTEQVVGTWIDGKPVYQKTIEYTTPITADGWVILWQDNDIDSLADYRVYVYSTGWWYQTDYYYTANEQIRVMFDNVNAVITHGKGIALQKGINFADIDKVIIHVRYTKTTD